MKKRFYEFCTDILWNIGLKDLSMKFFMLSLKSGCVAPYDRREEARSYDVTKTSVINVMQKNNQDTWRWN